MKNLKFYHDGCEICASVGQEIVNLIGLSNLEVIHVGIDPAKIMTYSQLQIANHLAIADPRFLSIPISRDRVFCILRCG